MLPLLLDACPSFDEPWRACLEEWGDRCDLPVYIALSELARHLIGMLDRGETEAFSRVFDVVERWHVEGDAYVRCAATVGLLEDLQNGNLHTARTAPEQFLPYLGPESRKWWHRVERFWSGDPSALQEP